MRMGSTAVVQIIVQGTVMKQRQRAVVRASGRPRHGGEGQPWMVVPNDVMGMGGLGHCPPTQPSVQFSLLRKDQQAIHAVAKVLFISQVTAKSDGILLKKLTSNLHPAAVVYCTKFQYCQRKFFFLHEKIFNRSFIFSNFITCFMIFYWDFCIHCKYRAGENPI